MDGEDPVLERLRAAVAARNAGIIYNDDGPVPSPDQSQDEADAASPLSDPGEPSEAKQPSDPPAQSALPLTSAHDHTRAAPQAPAQTSATNAKPKTFNSNDCRHGHRQRLRARFDASETLADYELLEL